MRDRPILFSGAMVRAILNGSKSQTRRIVKPQPPRTVLSHTLVARDALAPSGYSFVSDEYGEILLRCPYGVPGVRLWVRETCRAHELPQGIDGVFYDADGAFRPIENSREAADRWLAMNAYRGAKGATVPAIHMPRWASRITLEITDVRVERLQEISEADCFAEGIQQSTNEGLSSDGTARGTYRALWESINGAGSWDKNPYVWVISFHRVGL